MIFPWLCGFRDYTRAPITWMLAAACFIIFTATWQLQPPPKNPLLERRQLMQTGFLYLQYKGIKELPPAVEVVLMGGQALRDPKFLRIAKEFEFAGDKKEIAHWRKLLDEHTLKTESRAIYRFGLQREWKSGVRRPLTWVTYQFMHADAVHLLGNLVFLFLFGVAVESAFGGLTVLLVFLFGGMFGGLFSMWTDPETTLPMVGASASISALMGFYIIAEAKKRVRYFFFFSPFPGFFGDIYLSKWWIAPLCLLPDVGNWLADNLWKESQLIATNVATSTHIGGALFGILIALYVSGANPLRTVFSVTQRGSTN